MDNPIDETPVYIIEEHHEAFLIWNYARAKKLIKPSQNILLHVDEHSDSDVPKFTYSIHSLNGSLSDLHNFTYNQLTIANFIIPALYLGIFERLLSIYRQHPAPKSDNNQKEPESKTIYVRSVNNEGRILVAGKETDEIRKTVDPGRKVIHVERKTIDDEIECNLEVVLDIDLDYFSCNENPSQFTPRKIEITEEEFNSINNNKYHHVRISPNGGSAVKTVFENGKYFLSFFDYPYIVPSKLKVTDEEIYTRIDKFISFLSSKNIKPQIIDICRSGISGYTPADQVEIIQEHLLGGLKNLYPDLKIKNIENLLTEEKISKAGNND